MTQWRGRAGVSYGYDGAGLRVKKVAGATTTRYIFSGVKVIAEYVNGAAVGSPAREYIYSGSALLATIEGSTTTYHHQDHLSVRMNTDSNGAVVGQQGNYPFGEAWYTSSATTKWRFTSYERDSESGNDYANFRYHANRLGRFLTPDPLAGRITNPQSLNRYAYVINDPINLIDPLGLSVVCNGEVCYVDVGAPDPGPGPSGGGLGSGVDSHCPGGFNFLEYVCSGGGEPADVGTGGTIPTPGPSDPEPDDGVDAGEPKEPVPPVSPCIITSEFGPDHPRGIDVTTADWRDGVAGGGPLAGYGTPVVSPVTGTVASGTDKSGANFVSVSTSGGQVWTLRHLATSSSIAPGQTVHAGQSIGVTDRSGRQSNSHVHLEVTNAEGTRIDPASLLPNCKPARRRSG